MVVAVVDAGVGVVDVVVVDDVGLVVVAAAVALFALFVVDDVVVVDVWCR